MILISNSQLMKVLYESQDLKIFLEIFMNNG